MVNINVNNPKENLFENTSKGTIIIDETDPRLVNLRYLDDKQLLAWAQEEGNVYIGRRQDRLPGICFKWGNRNRPVRTDVDDGKEKCVEEFRIDLEDNRDGLMDDILELDGMVLGCWCVGIGVGHCHGRVL